MAHFLFLVRFVGQTIIDPEQNRTKSHEKVFVVILNRVPDNQECHDFLNSDGLGFIVEGSGYGPDQRMAKISEWPNSN